MTASKPRRSAGSNVAQVDSKGRHGIGRRDEVAFGEEVGVKTDNLMTEIDKKRRHLNAEVAEVAGDQDLHTRRNFPSRRAMFAQQGSRRKPAPPVTVESLAPLIQHRF